MPNIIQIEELVYTRLPRIIKSEWLTMLSKQGVANDYALLLDDYLLIEQTDYRFSNGNYISSERTVYNIDYTTYDTAENTPNPDNTEEIITVRYDSTHDRYYVYYTHFPIEDIPHTPDLSHILSEADMPIHGTFHQAPAETIIDTPVVQYPAQPAPQTKPSPAPAPKSQPTVPTEYHKPWRQKTLNELLRLYNEEKSLKEIASIMGKFENSIVYQLRTYLGVEHPFEKTPQQPVPKSHLQSQPTTQPNCPVRDKHHGRITWDGEIILSHLYKHPGDTISDISSSHKALTKLDVNRCIQGYFSGYVEKDKSGGYRLNQRGINEIFPYIDSLGKPETSLQEYQTMFHSLHRWKNSEGLIAPHKVILMLAIIHRYKNHIQRVMEIDTDLKVLFMDYWRKYVHSDEWTPNILMPWEHMTSEPFWHWVTDDSKIEAYLDDDLYYLLQHDKSARNALKQTLIEMAQKN